MGHDRDPEDPLCFGDDPCVCEQLHQARIAALDAAVQRVEALISYPDDNVSKETVIAAVMGDVS